MCVTLNRLFVRDNTDITPYEEWKGVKQDVSELRIWGCEAYGHVHPETRKGKKLEPRSRKGIFVGYWDSKSQYKLYHSDTRTFQLYATAKFNEQVEYLAPVSACEGNGDDEPVVRISAREGKRTTCWQQKQRELPDCDSSLKSADLCKAKATITFSSSCF